MFMPQRFVPIFLFSAFLTGCISSQPSPEDQVNRALKLCGLGLDSRSSDAYRVAFEFADKKGTASFDKTASEAVDTQIGIILKQANLKSDTGLKSVVEELNSTRECVTRQVEIARPAKRAELLELCRQDIQRKISPPGNMLYGVVRNWNQATGDLSNSEIVLMNGFFDTGGTASFKLKAKCDIRGGSFNESVVSGVTH